MLLAAYADWLAITFAAGCAANLMPQLLQMLTTGALDCDCAQTMHLFCSLQADEGADRECWQKRIHLAQNVRISAHVLYAEVLSDSLSVEFITNTGAQGAAGVSWPRTFDFHSSRLEFRGDVAELHCVSAQP